MPTKRERRLARKERNIEKDKRIKQEGWNNGKIIEPNHNNNYYPEEYSKEVGARLIDKPFLNFRQAIRDYLILCNPNARDENWLKLKTDYDNWLNRNGE